MIYVLYGALGVLLVLALVAAGFVGGWSAARAWMRHTKRAAAAEASEEERRALIQEQKAFETMLNYNSDRAYGLVTELDDLVGGDA